MRLRDAWRIWGPFVALALALPAAHAVGFLPLRFRLGDLEVFLALYHFTKVLLFIGFALGLAVVVGQAGLLELGFFAFVAIGSYVTVNLLGKGAPWWSVLPIGVGAAVLLRFAVGGPALRLRGDYLAIVTLAFGEIVGIVLAQDPGGWTGGPNGRMLQAPVPPPNPDQNPILFYFLALAYALFAALFLARVQDSRIGRAWRAIKVDEIAASASGVPVASLRMAAYAAGGFFAGLGGCLYCLYNRNAHPADYGFLQSVQLVAMIVFGGMETVLGPIVGAIFFVLTDVLFFGLARYRMLLFGLVLIAVVRFRPGGIFSRNRPA
jgi:branched-chain amino acid transport system permease protein